MLKPSLQLKLGQQLTMTPQLQQAIRLLQMPALELQAHIRELLETNVMLEPTEEAEATGNFEAAVTAAEPPWSFDEDERHQDYADDAGQSLQEHLLWQLEMASLAPRQLAIARAIVDAISDDGYITESLEEITLTLRPELESTA